MLKVFRDNLRSFSWVLWVVIIVFVGLVFVDLANTQQGAAGASARAAWAQDGDLEVSFSDYEQQYRNLESFYRQIYRDQFTPQLADQLKRQALNQAVDREILLEEADNMGLRATDAELQDAIREFSWLQDDDGNFIGKDMYVSRLQRSGFRNPSDFEALVREDLVFQKVQNLMQKSLFVPDAAVEKAYREQADRAKVRYLTLLNTKFASSVSVEQEDLETYFAANSEDYRLPEQREVSYLLIDTNLLRSKAEVSEVQIQEYYAANQDEFQQEEQVRARHILLQTEERTVDEARAQLEAVKSRIEGGEDFAEVAQEVSEDPGSKTRGGDLSYFGRGRMTPAFEEAAFNAEVGQLVGPLETPFGVHLILVMDHRQGGVRPLDQVETRIRHKLITDQANVLAEEKSGEVLAKLNEAEAAPEGAFQALADEFDYATLNTTPAFGRQDVIPGIGRSADFASAAFDMETGQTSDPIKVPRGWTILSVKNILEPRVPELTEVEARVRQAVLRDKQKSAARDRAEQARQQLANGTSLDDIASEFELDVLESTEFNSLGNIPGLGDSSAKVVAAAMGLGQGDIGGPVEGAQGFTLFEVTERKRWDPAEFEEQKEETRDSVESQTFQRLAQAHIEQRKRELNIMFHPQIVEETEGASAL